MTDTREEKRRRRWADVVVIIAAVYALMTAMWVPPEFYTSGMPLRSGTPAG